MATETTSMDSALKLIQLLTGGGGTTTKTSGGTTTQQTQISQDTLNATLKSALEGNQGLAALAAGQNNSGMYNSTVNQQLSDDLLARLTTDVAKESAPTVKTTSGTTQTTKANGQASSILPLMLMSGGKKAIDKAFGYIGGDTAASDVAGGAITAATSGVDTTSLGGILSASGDAFTSGAGFDSALWGTAGDAISSAVDYSAISDAAGEAVSGATDSLGTELLDKGTVICTEAARQRLLSQNLYKCELAHLAHNPLPDQTRAGYHYIAAPVVRWMKRDKRVAEFFAAWATDYIKGDAFSIPSWRHSFVKRVLLPLCHAVGYFVAGRTPELKGV